MPAWTPISKPTGTPYTNVNIVGGGEQYDQSNIEYDDPLVFYDGTNYLAWTDVSKPTGGSTTSIMGGFSQGLLIPLTRASLISVGADDWTNVDKPIT